MKEKYYALVLIFFTSFFALLLLIKLVGAAASGTPVINEPPFFMGEDERSSSYGTEPGEFDDTPISMNDYGNTDEKCGLWDCTGWVAGGTNNFGYGCQGSSATGWSITNWYGVSPSTYNCTGTWTANAASDWYFCNGGYNCTNWSSNNICKNWNCLAWNTTALTYGDAYCSGEWNCTAWNNTACSTWNCTAWTGYTGDDDDYYCSSGYNCTHIKNGICDTWDCPTWTITATDRQDTYCSGGWSCTVNANGICINWSCASWTLPSGTTNDGYDFYCDQWSCTKWNGTSKICQNWTCVGSTTMGATKYRDYYCNGGFSCTNWTILESTPPYFTSIPSNSSLFYGNESLGVYFSATDAKQFGYFSVNDTRFSINQTGFLTNVTPMSVGNYTLNITINDSSIYNNLNWTNYLVQVNKSKTDCAVYFNTSSPQIFPERFIVYHNCTGGTLYFNGTAISNGTTINSGAGYFNFSVLRDSVNHTNYWNSKFFTVNKNPEECTVLFNETSPLEYPKTFRVWANCTSPFTLYRNGTTILNNSEQVLSLGAYNFSFIRTDVENYSYIYNETQFRIIGLQCGTLNTPNKIYTLTENVSSQGTCFVIDADNVTLDCNGYWINYSISGNAFTYGIFVNNELNTTIKNCNILDGNWSNFNTTGETRIGLYFYYVHNSTLYNNFVNSSDSQGFEIFGNFNNLTNNTGISNDSVGIRIYYGGNSILRDNVGISNASFGIWIFGQQNTTLVNNTGISTTAAGIRVYGEGVNNTLINNTGISLNGNGNYAGIILTWTSNNTLIENNGTSNPTYGIYLLESSNNTLINNTGTSVSDSGIFLYGSYNNNLTNNLGQSTENRGIFLSGSNNNYLYNNTGKSTDFSGIQLSTSLNNVLIRNNATGGSIGYRVYGSNNTLIKDCTYAYGSSYDVTLDYPDGSINNTFINCSYTLSRERATAGNQLIRKWYYQAYVNDSSGIPIQDANVSAYNTTGQIQFTAQTNSTGHISRQEVIEYVNTGGTRSFYNNYNIFANKSGYVNDSNELNFTITQNKVDDWFSLEEADTCSCTGLNTNWEIDMSDYCNITTICNLGTGNITFVGTGETRLDSIISAANLGYPKTNQILFIKSGGIINLG